MHSHYYCVRAATVFCLLHSRGCRYKSYISIYAYLQLFARKFSISSHLSEIEYWFLVTVRANASNLFLVRNFSLDAVTMTAYGIVGSVRIDMVYWFSLVDLFRCFLFAEFCFLLSRSSDAYSGRLEWFLFAKQFKDFRSSDVAAFVDVEALSLHRGKLGLFVVMCACCTAVIIALVSF